ncbi:MAG TPA: MMPL family transporter [Candidatus Ozemobacteraceae bacterium]|nr:MMPL family transporter [Candidatus Ozemobacteraceae bacterium]
MKLVERLAEILLWLSERCFKPLAVVFCLVFAWYGPALLPLRVNNTLATLLEKDTPEERTDQAIKKTFGDLDEIMILAYHDRELFTPANLRLIVETTERISRVPGVRNCFSLSSTPFFRNTMENGELVLHCAPLVENASYTASECQRLKADAVNNRLFVNNIISPDGRTAAFNIVFEPDVEPFAKENIVRAIRSIYEDIARGATGRFYFTGMHVFMETTGTIMQIDITVFAILSMLFLFIALLAIFRRPAMAFVGIGSAIIANALLFLTLHFLGRTLSIATTPVPAITMGLALAYSLHILAAKHEGNLDHPDETREIFVGSIFSALTSIIGFGTSCLNAIPTLVDFGIYASIGTFYAWLTALFFTYPVMRMIRHRPHPRFARRFKFLLRLATARYRRAILATAVLCFFAGFLILRMEVQTDYYQYYRQSSPMTRAVDFVNRTIGGQYPIVVELDTGAPDGVYRKEVLQWLEGFKRQCETLTGVNKVITYLDLLNEGYKAYVDDLPAGWYDDPAKVSQIAMIVQDANVDLNGYYRSDNADKTLIFVRTSHINSANFLAIVNRINVLVAEAPLPNARFRVGGTYQRCVNSANSMALSQFQGTFWEVLVLFTMAFFIIWSFRLTVIAFLANLLPIFAVYGILSSLGETLNMGTTTIASISLSIGLDDTIHFVVRYMSAYQKLQNVYRSTREVIRSLGTKMMLASLMISLAFCTLAFSNILPIFQLGVYTVVSMILCFLANMFLVPVLITMKKNPSSAAPTANR